MNPTPSVEFVPSAHDNVVLTRDHYTSSVQNPPAYDPEAGGLQHRLGDLRVDDRKIVQLPGEILEKIFLSLHPGSLARCAAAGSSLYHAAIRILYRYAVFNDTTRSLPNLISFLRVIRDNPSLASQLRSLEIHYERPSQPQWLAAMATLLQAVFHCTSNLTSLALLLPGCPGRVLTNVSFKLVEFATSIEWDSALAGFLASQSTIRTITFGAPSGVMANRAFTLERFARNQIDVTSLPHLEKVSATPLILSRVVPKRPVSRVEIMFDPWMFTHDILSSTCKILAFSSGPLKSLAVTGHVPHRQLAQETLNILAAVPATLPDIEVLDVCAVTGPINQDVLIGLPTVISRFSRLLALVIVSQDKADAVHDHTLTSSILSSSTPGYGGPGTEKPSPIIETAAQFISPPQFLPLLTLYSNAQPSLNCVSFGDVTYVKTKSLGWVHIADLQRVVRTRKEIITARERELQFVNKSLQELEAQRTTSSP